MNKKIKGKILAVCQSREKGTVKKEIGSGVLIENYGLENDAHAGKWHRQISLLGIESINKMKGNGFKIKFGDFAENLTTENIILPKLPLGTKLAVGESVLLEVTQIEKNVTIIAKLGKKLGIV